MAAQAHLKLGEVSSESGIQDYFLFPFLLKTLFSEWRHIVHCKTSAVYCADVRISLLRVVPVLDFHRIDLFLRG